LIFALAAVIGILFGAGATLVLSRDLFRIAAGTVLLSNAINLFLLAAGRSPPTPMLQPFQAGAHADPLVQALVLTAMVITLGVAALLLGLVIRVRETHGTIDLDDIAQAERQEEERLEREPEVV
jgi:multicomponent Na+:H+ antiporter subunit C